MLGIVMVSERVGVTPNTNRAYFNAVHRPYTTGFSCGFFHFFFRFME